MSTAKKYLYWNYYDTVKRSEIIKETDFFYWLKNGDRVSKATMKSKQAYSSQKFQVESVSLLERYKESYEIDLFNDKIQRLVKLANNAEVRKQVFEIKF